MYAMETLDSFIRVHRGFFSPEFCDQILNEYKDSTFIRGEHPTAVDFRNLSELNISGPVINEKNSYYRKKLDLTIHDKVATLLEDYKDLPAEFDTGYSLRKMVTGNYYKQHTDAAAGSPSKLTASIVLNDAFTGGEFCFFDREICITLNKGDCLTFPSSFQYPHEVREITSGTRYALVTWFY